MRDPGVMRILRILGSATVLLAGAAAPVAAQCPMCGEAAAYAGATPGSAYPTFQAAALVLLIPVVLFLGSAGLLLRKFRH